MSAIRTTWMQEDDDMGEYEILEKYIDSMGEKEFIDKLTPAEQVLYKCQLRDTISFKLFYLHEKIIEFAHLLVEFIKKGCLFL